MIIKYIHKQMIFVFFVLVLLPMLTAISAHALTTQVSPEKVNINLRYNGAKLMVTGQSKTGDDLIIRITNSNGDAHYKYIGKAGGLVWMKKGDISFKNVPGVYMIYSTRDLDHILSPAEQKANLIGFDAINEKSEVETENKELLNDASRWQHEFIRFKQNENLYSINTGTVTRQHGEANDTYQVEVSWPYQAATGDYVVETMAVRDGRIVERAKSNFSVARAGLVAKLTNLAFNQAALYGIMAVIIAIAAGFAVGLIFKKGGGAH